MPNYKMQMGHHSKDSDGTFKEKDKNAILGKIYRESGKNNFQPLNVKVQDNITNFESGKAPVIDHLSNKKSNVKLSQSDVDSVLNPPSSTNNTPPSTSSPATPVSQPKKPYVKKGGKATGKMKNYALYSDARKKEYDARGWAYDDTIKGYNKDGSKKQKRTQVKSTVSAIKPITSADIKPQISASPVSIPTIKPSTPQSKSSKIRAKGEAALDQGKVFKAKRLRNRYERIQKREVKKAQRQQKRQDRKTPVQDGFIYDSATGFGYDPSKFKVYSAVSNTDYGAKTHAERKAYHDNQTGAFDSKTFKINRGTKKEGYKVYKIYKIK